MAKDWSHGETLGEVRRIVEAVGGVRIADDQPLISSRLLESIAAVQLIDRVEGVFDVVIDDDDVALANFDTVESITTLVQRLLDGR